MKCFVLFTGSGPMVILTKHNHVEDPSLLAMLAVKGIEKFLAFEVPVELAQRRYGGHFTVVSNDLKESDALRVLDFNGERAFRQFDLNELGEPLRHEAPTTQHAA